MTHNLGKADWAARDRIDHLIDSYSRRYGVAFWNSLVELIGSQSRSVIADFGCGPGLFLVDASNRFSAQRLIGLDESEEMLEQAEAFILERAKTVSYELTTVNFDEAALPLPPHSVDLAFSGYVLHEVKSPQEFVNQVSRTLRPRGQYVVYDFISSDEEIFVKKIAELGMSEENARRRYPHMCKHSMDDIKDFLERSGLKEVRGVAVNDIRALVAGLAI
jgi:ubiquinone/menaquinone biosynthesis C-methylase UbiE